MTSPPTPRMCNSPKFNMVHLRMMPSSSSSLYIWNQGSSYLIYWQLGAWFQIYRELEDEGWFPSPEKPFSRDFPFQVPGTKFQVPGTKFQVPGTFLVRFQGRNFRGGQLFFLFFLGDYLSASKCLDRMNGAYVNDDSDRYRSGNY